MSRILRVGRLVPDRISPRPVITAMVHVSAVLRAMWMFIKWYGRRKIRQVEHARRFINELDR